MAEVRADEWLARHTESNRYFADVALARVHAAFAVAEHADTVESWRDFLARYPEPAALVEEARGHEASAWFRDIAVPNDTVEIYRSFRLSYPAAADVPEAKRLELDLAFAEASSDPGTTSLARFRTTYEAWPESRELVDQARAAEMERAFVDARAEGSTAALRTWIDGYGAWTQRPDLVEEAHALADVAVAGDALAVLLGHEWDDAFLGDWMGANEALPALGALAREQADVLWDRASDTDSPDAWWVTARLLVGSPRGAEADANARAALWAAGASDAQHYAAYVRRFPADEAAWDAEVRWLAANERAVPRSRSARLQRRRDLPNGDVELTLDVVDCNGQRLAGLTRESFALRDEDQPVEITDFTSLEQDRPLGLVIALDLSGSMATERAAVDAAVERFSETLRFRNRNLEIGLIGFSDGVLVNHAPSARTANFRSWMRQMPENVGGGGSEDSAGALVDAASQLAKTRGERVVVLLSDEVLQVNLRGRQALRLRETPCDGLRALGGCLGWCESDRACKRSCFAQAEPRYARMPNQCPSYQREDACLDRAVSSVAPEIQRCSAADDHPELVDTLARGMAPSGTRLYFLAPPGESAKYASLAAETGGRVLSVPDDTTDPRPYEAALLDIADQLSKQVVVTYRPTSEAMPEVAVRPDWRWVESELPAVVDGGAPTLRPDAAWPATLRVDADGGVSRSLDGSTWRPVLPPEAPGRVLVSDTTRVCTAGGASVWCSTDLGRSWSRLGQTFDEAAPIELFGSRLGIFARQGGRTYAPLRVVSRDLPASSLYFSTNADGFERALEPFLDELSARLVADPALQLRIEGHADARGSDAHNDDLALRRASNVAAAIRQRGAQPDQLDVLSFGERFPVRAGSSEKDLAHNRRVEMILLEPEPDAAEAGCGTDAR